ncbi:MAG: 1-deoxy-D-xylulose-5-phosphate reductoisomerase [Planctomycetota bacterium]
MKRVAILGSTGSIGQNAIRLLEDRRDRFRVVFLAANRSAEALAAQAGALDVPELALVGYAPDEALPFEPRPGTRVSFGTGGLLEGLERSEPDLVLNAVMGSAGLEASAWTLGRGLGLLLANKESLVCAGPLLTALARDGGGTILPVDSEHAAIHQCLRGERREDLRRVWLTASGGPFRDFTAAAIAAATREQALAHPTWRMGPRITIGSATLMNKAFEVIEAHHLFGLAPEEIRVVQHRQSIVHSMVELRDGSILAQCGLPDMRVPILYCLGWPERLDFAFEGFDLEAWKDLSFEPVDPIRFPALDLAPEVLRRGGDSGAVVNAADEVAVQAFLDGRIPFPRITETVREVLERLGTEPLESIGQVLEADARARREAQRCLD